MGLRTQFKVATNLHQVFVARLWPSDPVLSKGVGMDIELHGNELDNVGWGEGDVGKWTMQEAKEQQIEREAESVGCPTAGPRLLHFLRCEPEEPT